MERRVGAAWRARSTQKWFKNQDPRTSPYINLLRRREASPHENPRTRLDVLETARWRINLGFGIYLKTAKCVFFFHALHDLRLACCFKVVKN